MIKRRRFLAMLVAIATLVLAALTAPGTAAAQGGARLLFPDEPVGQIDVTDAGSVPFIQIAPFARFASFQGDFTSGAHGTFGIFGAGAASPPHTHSDTYYGVVLSGEMNNPFGTETDPPSLTSGSFWSVPADEQHVTACLSPDQECSFFFHAASAFDFLPIDELSEPRSDEASAIAVEDLSFASLEPFDGVAAVWGDADTGPFGVIARVDGGSVTGWNTHRQGFSMVPTSGDSILVSTGGVHKLNAGDLVEAGANAPHSIVCKPGDDCLFYLYGDGPLEIRTKGGRR